MLNHSTTYLSITSLREKMKAGVLRELWHGAEGPRRKDISDRSVFILVVVLICRQGPGAKRDIKWIKQIYV